jgi:hypothetical protein
MAAAGPTNPKLTPVLGNNNKSGLSDSDAMDVQLYVNKILVPPVNPGKP